MNDCYTETFDYANLVGNNTKAQKFLDFISVTFQKLDKLLHKKVHKPI